jgi:hypothetical protein
MAESEYKYDVFISYSHKDGSWIRDTLLPTLEKRGLKVCIDFRDFIAGRAAILNMMDASKTSRHTLLVLTPNWVKSEWTTYESLLARTGAPSDLQRRTIPLLLETCEVPDYISLFTWVNLTDASREEEAWRNLFHSLGDIHHSSDKGTTEQNPLAKAVADYRASIQAQMDQAAQAQDLESPYKALLEYDIRDTRWFFGREEATQNLLRAVNESRLTVLHSKSGSGKTSLLKARYDRGCSNGVTSRCMSALSIPLWTRPSSGRSFFSRRARPPGRI